MGRRSIWKRLVVGVTLTLVLAWIGLAVGVVYWGARDGAERADAIVVLGAAQYVGRPSPVLKARLDHAIALWSDGMAPLLVVTGGIGAGDTTSEGAVSRQYALKRGIPDSVILVEDAGRTTRESVRAVAEMMRARGLNSAILVSDPFHMLRLSIVASGFGVTAHTSPTRTSPISANRFQTVRYILSESLKIPLVAVQAGLDE